MARRGAGAEPSEIAATSRTVLHRFRRGDRPPVHPRSPFELRIRGGPRVSRPVPVHPGSAAYDVPEPAVDDAPVRRIRVGGGYERTFQIPPLAGSDRTFHRVPLSDAHGIRLRLSPREGR